nr:hypothetical protein [uncultured Rhodopila sp.]
MRVPRLALLPVMAIGLAGCIVEQPRRPPPPPEYRRPPPPPPPGYERPQRPPPGYGGEPPLTDY